MAEVIMQKKKNRVRCSDEKFLEAVFNSTTYEEIAEKTGQKVASTIARYTRTKKVLAERNIDIPEIKRTSYPKDINNVDNMIEIVKKLKEHHKGE
jgi:hypothetical protein